MRYWNSQEILDEIFKVCPIETPDMQDMIIDFVIDIVQMHNFQIERESSKTNEDVARVFVRFISTFAIYIFHRTADLCDTSIEELGEMYGEKD